MGNSFDPDINARQTRIREIDRTIFGDDLIAFNGLVPVYNLMIRRQQQSDSGRAASLFYPASRVEHIVFDQRLSDSESIGFQERVSHGAANQQPIDFSINQGI